LALVANGAAPSNKIEVGQNPMQAEALHEMIESLQVDLTPPENVQDHAQDVLDWREDDEKDVQGMTDTGWNRAEQLASGEELSVNDVQEISAWFARHGSEEYDVPEDKEPWQDNGRVAIKGWGGPPMRDWIQGKREQLVEQGELEAMSAEALKEVAGVEFEDTGTGDLDESEIPNEDFEGHYLYPEDTKSESSYPVVDGEGVLRKGNVESAWQLGARGDVDEEEHDNRLMDLAMEFDDPPEWAMEEDADMSGHMDEEESMSQSDDGTQEDKSQSSVAGNSEKETRTMDELSENEVAVLEAAESLDEPIEALEEYAAMEQPYVIDESTYESMRGILEDALSEKAELKESTIEALSFNALVDEFRTEDGELKAEALIQEPESSDPPAEENGPEALGEDADKEKAEALYQDYQTFENERLKDDIVDALGVDDFDTAMEVLE
jgi:hypothetical protein